MSPHTMSPRSPGIRAVQTEHRQAPRRRCIRETTCQAVVAGKDESAPAILEDLSTTGLRLVVRRHYEPGRVLALSWRNPPDGPKHTLVAQVVHARNDGMGSWIIGCVLMIALTKEELTALL
jgi:hypothetical protein